MRKDHNKTVTWREARGPQIVLTNKSSQNFILELPAGRFRLDAGRQMRTVPSILEFDAIRQLVDQGLLSVDNS